LLISVEQVEQATPLDFLHDLPDDQEWEVEAAVTADAWQGRTGIAWQYHQGQKMSRPYRYAVSSFVTLAGPFDRRNDRKASG